MTNLEKNEQIIVDQLAAYTDLLMSGKPHDQEITSPVPDPDLKALQLTALRLQTAFTGDELDQATIQRMYRNIIQEMRQKEQRKLSTVWRNLIASFKAPGQKWASQQSRQRFSLMATLTAVMILLLMAVPFLNTAGDELAGTSGQRPSLYVLIAIGALILLAVWLMRRRP